MCEEVASTKTTLSLKIRNTCEKGNRRLKKLIEIIYRKSSLALRVLMGNLTWLLSGWPEPTEEEIIGYVCVILSSQTFKVVYITNKKLPQFLLLTAIISFLGACFCSKINRPTSGCFSRFKGELVEMTIRCHSLPFVVTRCSTRYHSLNHLLLLVVTRCVTRLSFYKRSYISCL